MLIIQRQMHPNRNPPHMNKSSWPIEIKTREEEMNLEKQKHKEQFVEEEEHTNPFEDDNQNNIEDDF